MFEQAVRRKFRFESELGGLTVEDLWDLPLSSRRGVSLDDIAIGLHRQLQETATLSFVTKVPLEQEKLQLKFDIVKHIIDTKLAEQQAAQDEAEKKAKKEKLLLVLARKQDAALEELPMDELQRMIAEL